MRALYRDAKPFMADMRKTLLYTFLCIWLLAPLDALARDDATPLDAVFACSAISDNAERLACYDRTVGAVQSATTSGRVVTIDREQVETLRRESFGLSLPSVLTLFARSDSENAIELNELSFAVQEIVAHPDGRHTFVMSNGQRWSQLEPDRPRNVRTGDNVTIRRAALGSYMLFGERGVTGYRVRRTN